MSGARRTAPSFVISAERWLVLEPLIDAALDLPPAERRMFVDQVELKDGGLAAELRRAIEQCERTDSFFSGAAVDRFGALLEQTPPELLGERFRIEREIGRGGMATVYLARDQRHDRAVAVKILRPEAGAEIGIERFLREIRVVARLQHAHIVPLYDSGDDRGWLYYVMPVMNGKSLRDRIAREGPLSLEVALRIAREIGGALEYAHQHGLIHRDIKPENILFDDDRALLADFGIARTEEVTHGTHAITADGVSIGTPGYMSPEQSTVGSPVDARSDVYSLACVVYEMLVGVSPFIVQSPRGMAARHALEPAISLSTERPDLPSVVEDTLRRALAADPDDRFSSAQDFVHSLTGDEAAPLVSSAARSSGTFWRRRWRGVAGMVAGVLVLGLSTWWIPRRVVLRDLVKPDATVLTIAVQPFENISGRSEDDYLSDGVVDEQRAALARIPGVSVTPRSSSIRFRKADSRTMGESLHVAWVLEGTLGHVGSQLLVRPTLVNVKTGRIAWSGEYDRELRDIIDVQHDMVRTIADTLRLMLLPAQARTAGHPPANIDAYINYLKGRYYWNQRLLGALDTAVTYFRAALAYDSSYALAYSGLADAYSLRGWAGVAPRETYPLARIAAEHALALDSNLAAAHASLGFVEVWYDWDWTAGQREIDRAVALDSTYPSAVLFRAWYLIPRGRLDDALAAAQRAQRLEGLSPIISARIGTILAFSHRFREAESSLRKTLETNPGFPIASAQLARVLAVTGRMPEAIAALPRPGDFLGGYEAGVAGFVYARAGNRDAALQQIRILEARPYKPADAIAAIYSGLGDRDAAIFWLKKAYEARSGMCVILGVEPMFDSLHSDPRFKRLAEQIHIVVPDR